MNALGQTISICRLREHGEHIYIINAGRLECQGLPSRLEGLAAVRDLIFSRHLIGCSQRLLEVFGPTEALLPEQYVERGLMVVLLIPKC